MHQILFFGQQRSARLTIGIRCTRNCKYFTFSAPTVVVSHSIFYLVMLRFVVRKSIEPAPLIIILLLIIISEHLFSALSFRRNLWCAVYFLFLFA